MKVHGNAWRGGFVSNTFAFMGCIEWELCIKRKGSEGSEGSKGKVDGAFGPEGYGRLSAAGCVEGERRPLAAEGGGIALRAMSMKSALRKCLPAPTVILSAAKDLGKNRK